MARKGLSILLACILIFSGLNIGFCQNKNLPRKEVEKIIEEVATKRGIPSVILKCIARIESNFNQFKNGRPLIGAGTYIGIMQVSKNESSYNLEKLKYDPVYNVEAGANHLLGKWKWVNDSFSHVGNMDPNILEHWYFALWGYNGLLERNNPNSRARTYQSRVYDIALKDYGQEITPVSRAAIPSRGGVPRRGAKVPTPEEFHEGDILKYSPGDIVRPDTMEKATGKVPLVLHDKPRGKSIGTVKEDLSMTILEEAVLNKGFYFYKVKVNEDDRIGWVYGNWICKVASEEKPIDDNKE